VASPPGCLVDLPDGGGKADVGELPTDAGIELERPADQTESVVADLVVGEQPSGNLPHEPVDTSRRRVDRWIVRIESQRHGDNLPELVEVAPQRAGSPLATA
jgi:hypothetical protein